MHPPGVSGGSLVVGSKFGPGACSLDRSFRVAGLNGGMPGKSRHLRILSAFSRALKQLPGCFRILTVHGDFGSDDFKQIRIKVRDFRVSRGHPGKGLSRKRRSSQQQRKYGLFDRIAGHGVSLGSQIKLL